jgi:hypothetical protein
VEGFCEHGNEPAGSVKYFVKLRVAEGLVTSEAGLSFM